MSFHMRSSSSWRSGVEFGLQMETLAAFYTIPLTQHYKKGMLGVLMFSFNANANNLLLLLWILRNKVYILALTLLFYYFSNILLFVDC